MVIGTGTLSTKVNAEISGTLTALEQLQLASVVRDFEQGFAKCAANCAALPASASNKGRWIYLQDVCSYRWSDGLAWSNDFTSTAQNFAFSWGNASQGKLGDGQIAVNRSSPDSVVGGFSDWCQVSAGYSHNLGVRKNGTAWGWGRGYDGAIGDGTNLSRSSPVSVVGGFTDWCQVSGGTCHSLGVRTNGTAWGWGRNGNGQLGTNGTTITSSPVSVVGGFTDWCQVSAGNLHSVGLKTGGSVWAWGFNNCGQLGDNTVVSRSSPVLVNGLTNINQISAGISHSLGVQTNGTAWAWGSNSYGQLGVNDIVAKSSPVSVVGGFTDWCQVSAGYRHSVGLRTNGTAWSWGLGSFGRLGAGDGSGDKSSPVSVVGGFTDWCQVDAGNLNGIGVRTNGTAWAWGSNSSGQLGTNNTTNTSSPVSVVGGSVWRQVNVNTSSSTNIIAILSKGF